MSIEAVALQDPELRELVKNQLQLAVEKESLTVASMKREAERILNDGRETGDFTYIGNVGEIAVHSMIEKLELFSRRNPGAPIKISLNSGGGSVIDGFALVDYLLMLRRRGHKITITVFGFAASMAGVILMAADERVMTPRASLGMHEVSYGMYGNTSQQEDNLRFTKELEKRCVELLCARSKLTPARLKSMWKRKDVWVDASKALELNLIDRIEEV
jgi:ATP-dependent protease ClpP protease subunit